MEKINKKSKALFELPTGGLRLPDTDNANENSAQLYLDGIKYKLRERHAYIHVSKESVEVPCQDNCKYAFMSLPE